MVVPVGGEGLPVGPSVFEPCAIVDKPGVGVVVPISVAAFWTVLHNYIKAQNLGENLRIQ